MARNVTVTVELDSKPMSAIIELLQRAQLTPNEKRRIAKLTRGSMRKLVRIEHASGRRSTGVRIYPSDMLLSGIAEALQSMAKRGDTLQ